MPDLAARPFKDVPESELYRFLGTDVPAYVETKRRGPYQFYKPLSEKHRRFHMATNQYRFVPGGNRSGKSTMALMEVVWNAVGWWPEWLPMENRAPPACAQRIVSTPKAIDRRIVPFLKRWIPPEGVIKHYDKRDHLLQFWNGALIEIMSFEQDLVEFAGDSRHVIVFDEHCEDELKFNECLARVFDVEGKVVVNLCPWIEETGGGLTWEYDRLYLPALAGTEGIGVGTGKTSAIWMEVFTIHDNPNYSEEKIRRLMRQFSDEEREAREFGRFVRRGGLVFNEYQDAEPWLHRDFDAADPKDRLWLRNKVNLWLIIDPAQNRANVAVFIAQTSEGDFVIDDVAKNCTNEDFAGILRERFNLWGKPHPSRCIIDYNADEPEKTSGGDTTQRQLSRLLGLYFRKSVKRNEDTHISTMRKWLQRDSVSGKPWLRICRRASRTRYELTHWGQDIQGKRDKEGNDAIDCIRYYAAVRPIAGTGRPRVGCPTFISESGIWEDNALAAREALGLS